MHNVSAHQLPEYYQPQWEPSVAGTNPVMYRKLACIQILQNFWFTFVFYFGINIKMVDLIKISIT